MAITLVQRKKIQQGLILVLVAVLLITTIVLWLGFFKQGAAPTPEIVAPALKPVEINFGVLEIPFLQTLEAPPESVLAPELPGRSNPFLPF